MNNFTASRRDTLAKTRPCFQKDHFTTAARQLPCDSQADNAGTDNNRLYLIVVSRQNSSPGQIR